MTPLVSATLLRTQSDGRLVALAAQGHERAFEAIVERYRRQLHRFCRRVLPEARAEDAVQQTFLKAWTALGAGTQVEDLRAWLYRIARNAALDSAKKAGYDYAELTESLKLAPGVDEDLERRAIIRETLTGVATLPGNQREALLRTAVEGHSRAEIARDMRITEGAVRQLVHRARTTLRAAATVLTPLPIASWAAAFDGTPAADAPQRIAEVAAGAGSASGAGALFKAGTAVVAAGVLAAGPPGTALRHVVEHDGSGTPDAQAAPAPGDGGSDQGQGQGDSYGRSHGAQGEAGGRGHGHGAQGRHAAGDDHGSIGGSRRSDVAGDDHPGTSGSGDDRRSGSSGSGSSGSGSSGSGSGGDHHGSGSSGSGSSGSGSSGPGPGGDDHSGPGSGTSGSDDGVVSGGSDDVVSGSSGEGPSGSGSSGPGSGETTTTTTTTETSHSGSDDGVTSGSTPDGHH